MKHLNYYETLKAYADDNVEKYTIPTVSYIKENNILKYKKDAEGLVARWKAYDKTNNDVDKAILKDLSGNGHDINLKNLSYTLGSGYGLWPAQMTNVGSQVNFTHTHYSFVIPKRANTMEDQDFGFYQVGPAINPLLEFNLVVSNLSDLDDVYVDQYLHSSEFSTKLHNGINYIRFDISKGSKPSYPYISFYSTTPITTEISCEIVPRYQGGLIFDGIADYGVCESMPIQTDYTICCIRKLFGSKGLSLSKRSEAGALNGAFILERFREGKSGAISFGLETFVTPAPLFFYQTTESYSGTKIIKGTKLDTTRLSIASGVYGSAGAVGEFSNLVFYAAELYDRTLSDAELQSVKDRMLAEWYEKAFDPAAQEYQALWTSNGKTNADVNKNVPNLVDATNPLRLNNFAYAGNSGYQLFGQDFRGFSSADPAKMDNSIRTYNIYKGTAVINLMYIAWYNGAAYVYQNKSFNVKLTSNLPGLTGYFYWKNKEGVEIKRINIVQNTIVTIPVFTDEEFILLSISSPLFQPSLEGTSGDWYQLEQIPEGEGLFLDGVDDSFTSVKSLPALTDYTIVGDLEFFGNGGKGIAKPSNWYWYPKAIYINQEVESNIVEGVIGFNSSGLIVQSSGFINTTKVGGSYSSGTIFSWDYIPLNFKSFAIIPEILNEAQIRATYDYIKTLKANNI